MRGASQFIVGPRWVVSGTVGGCVSPTGAMIVATAGWLVGFRSRRPCSAMGAWRAPNTFASVKSPTSRQARNPCSRRDTGREMTAPEVDQLRAAAVRRPTRLVWVVEDRVQIRTRLRAMETETVRFCDAAIGSASSVNSPIGIVCCNEQPATLAPNMLRCDRDHLAHGSSAGVPTSELGRRILDRRLQSLCGSGRGQLRECRCSTRYVWVDCVSPCCL